MGSNVLMNQEAFSSSFFNANSAHTAALSESYKDRDRPAPLTIESRGGNARLSSQASSRGRSLARNRAHGPFPPCPQVYPTRCPTRTRTVAAAATRQAAQAAVDSTQATEAEFRQHRRRGSNPLV